jgi:hypothetical protein
MFKKKDKHSNKGQESDTKRFTDNVPTGQNRRVINPFVDRQKSSDSARRLDDFQRVEGYQSFTPRTVGMPMSENNNEAFGTDTLASQGDSHAGTQKKKRSHRLFKFFRRII